MNKIQQLKQKQFQQENFIYLPETQVYINLNYVVSVEYDPCDKNAAIRLEIADKTILLPIIKKSDIETLLAVFPFPETEPIEEVLV